MSKSNSEEGEMSFLEHLEALRWHLVRSTIVILVLTFVAFFQKELIFDGIIFAPIRPDFWTYKLLCDLSTRFNLDMCITKIDFQLINNELSGQFTMHLWVSFLTGLIVGFPYLIWEMWRFIKPALRQTERSSTNGILIFISSLFSIGVLFGYYIITPMSITFLGSYQISPLIGNMISLDSYISTISILTLATGLVFEMPIIIYFLSKIGIMTPQFMRKYRKHAYVIILIVAAIITPTPDISGQILVSIPLVILYEISIFVSAGVQRNKAKETI